ncbi:MAG: hypothetical protein NW201_11615 [Gemmatimonadales bacterium]|nr:hypothetical protein [Gemmatimonadales bacterium]
MITRLVRAAAAATLLVPAALAAQAEPGLTVSLDSARREVVIVAGPFDAPQMGAGHGAAGHGDAHGGAPEVKTVGSMMDHGEAHDTPLQRFRWPVDGYLRGFRIEVTDGEGKPLPRRILHHLIMVNFDRRQLLYHAAERIIGAGSETDDYSLPRTIGMPVKAGTNLGLYAGWHNDLGRDLPGVKVKLVLDWTALNQNPKPLAVLPIYMDVNLVPGMPNSYDVPPGKSTKVKEFTLPVGGKLLGVGGHLHDYGSAVRLEDAETGKVLTQIRAKRLKDGRVTGLDRKLFGVSGEGLVLKAGRRYRVVGEYDNPTGQLLRNGAMAHMVGIFVPDDISKWPTIDPNDVDFQRDLAVLNLQGEDGGEHNH